MGGPGYSSRQPLGGFRPEAARWPLHVPLDVILDRPNDMDARTSDRATMYPRVPDILDSL